MKINSIAIILTTMVSVATPGALLEFRGTPTFEEKANDKPVATYPEAFVIEPSVKKVLKVPLKLSGAGLRKKKLFFKAYWAASYVEDPTPLKSIPLHDITGRMDAMAKYQVKAIHLTFLRDLDSETINEAFKDGLKANHVDLNLDVIRRTFQKMTFSVKEGETLTILAVTNGGKDTLFFEAPKNSFSETGEGLARIFWSMWFGEAMDGGIKDLQPKLTGQREL